MKTNVKRLVQLVIMVAVAALPAQGVFADSHCDHGPTKHKLKVRVDNGKPKKVEKENGDDGDVVGVCMGDTVEWKLKNSNDEFAVDFGDDAPFSGKKQKDSHDHKIEVEITSGNPGQSFKYSVWIGDEELDPRIVIDD